MIDYLIIISLNSSLAAFLLTLLRKWGFVERLQVHGNDLISEMAHCDFCLSWWTNVAVSIIAAIVMKDWTILFAPIFSTMITRKLL